MPYCPRCGVEVEDRMERCPLCNTAIPEEVRDREKREGVYPSDMVGPRRMNRPLSLRQKRVLILSLSILSCLLPILLTPLLDYIQNGGITWSYYVIISLLGIFMVPFLFILFAGRPMISVNLILLIAFFWFMLLNKQFPKEFVLSTDFRIIALASFFVEWVLLFFRRAKRKWYGTVSFLLIVTSFFLPALELSLSGHLGWSLISDSALLPMALFILAAGKIRRKGLNIVSLFFSLLVLMLLFLDVTTDFSGWSLITSAIFCFLAFAAYMLHVAVFRDTDWKKILHL